MRKKLKLTGGDGTPPLHHPNVGASLLARPGSLTGSGLAMDREKRLNRVAFGDQAPAHLQRAFTLLEVLLALVIVAIGLILVGQGFSVGLKASRIAAREEEAVRLAESLLARLEAGEMVAQCGQGDFGDALQDSRPETLQGRGKYSSFHWEMEFEPTDLTGLEELTVTILWGEEEVFRLVRLWRSNFAYE